jgi:hypothetical protein
MAGRAESAGAFFVEAERFAEHGGWVIDQQFTDQMGSPFLMAHGLGRPVKDAETVAETAPGTYRLWVRTRDWCAPSGPGEFEVLVNGNSAGRFGKGGDGTWSWWKGGAVVVKERTELALRDLTGFAGRVDALAFVPEGKTPPERVKAAPVDGGEYDLVVVGGGFAGMCAALSSARAGAKTLLVQDRPVLGGNASVEIRVPPKGCVTNILPFAADLLRDVRDAMRGGPEMQGGFQFQPNQAGLAARFAKEPNLTLAMSTRMTGAETDKGGKILSVIGERIDSGLRTRYRGRFFADCTGDAALAVKAGAAVRREPETFEETGENLARKKGMKGGGYGATNFAVAEWRETESVFPDCPWAMRIERDEDALLPLLSEGYFKRYAFATGWDWETGFYEDNVANGEMIRDRNFRAVYGTWDYLKNRSAKKANYAKGELSWMAYLLGKRAAVRIEGDHLLTEQDIVSARAFADAAVTASWHIDLHFPHPAQTPKFPGEEFRAAVQAKWCKADLPADKFNGEHIQVKPYNIPFRCLYSRTCPNLFMAGKNISATYVALGSVRVMHTGGLMGAVIGRAAACCAATGRTPREFVNQSFHTLQNPGQER